MSRKSADRGQRLFVILPVRRIEALHEGTVFAAVNALGFHAAAEDAEPGLQAHERITQRELVGGIVLHPVHEAAVRDRPEGEGGKLRQIPLLRRRIRAVRLKQGRCSEAEDKDDEEKAGDPAVPLQNERILSA